MSSGNKEIAEERDRIAPGGNFPISVGGLELKGKVLSVREKRQLMKLVRKIEDFDSQEDKTEECIDEAFDAIEKAVEICIHDFKPDLLDQLDESDCGQVIREVLAGAKVSAGDAKKSE
ncbi:MAG: hypothetical protein AAF394_11490 [Planctomycetota bacterium]